MTDKIFVDSNIWVYMFLQDNEEKYKIAEDCLLEKGANTTFIITYQIINEVSNALLRNEYSEMEIREIIEYMLKICTIQDFTKEIVLLASSTREAYSFSFWDSIIVGSALFSGCNMLVSEDMQNGLIVNRKLLIKNIFKK
ncbi:MAG: PIN domain-containing protein [Treponema sp.]|jgi:predicted nucleic acid-binding protein|nr:PIN domain-containing protein [Treponema sp.]